MLLERTWQNFTSRIGFFSLVILILVLFGSIPILFQHMMGETKEELLFVLINLGVGLIMSWLFVAVMYQGKSFFEETPIRAGTCFWEALLDTPGFILYVLLYGLSVIAGTALLILPGIYAGFVFIFVTLIVVLDGNRASYFGWSRKLVHSDPLKVIGPVLVYGIASMMVTFPAYLIPKSDLRTIFRIILLIPDALVEILFGLYLVHLYYDLRKKISGTAPEQE